jgi:hypothetical protein
VIYSRDFYKFHSRNIYLADCAIYCAILLVLFSRYKRGLIAKFVAQFSCFISAFVTGQIFENLTGSFLVLRTTKILWNALCPLGLHCIALHCIALHCIALHCIALHCIALYCKNCIILYYYKKHLHLIIIDLIDHTQTIYLYIEIELAKISVL